MSFGPFTAEMEGFRIMDHAREEGVKSLETIFPGAGGPAPEAYASRRSADRESAVLEGRPGGA